MAGLSRLKLQIELLVGMLLALTAAGTGDYLSPTALVAGRDGKDVFVACATGNRVLCVDKERRKVVASIPVPEPPSGLALSADERKLFVTCAGPQSEVEVVEITGIMEKGEGKKEIKGMRIIGRIAAGHTAMAPVLSPDGRTLYVCNRFNNDVSELDLATGRERRRIAVQREPVAAAITPAGRFLLVANYLPQSGPDPDDMAAAISVVDTAAGKVTQDLPLMNGSGSVNDLKLSPDGHYAAVTHLLARFHAVTTRVDGGWMNKNVLGIIDVDNMTLVNTVPLDDGNSAAGNPWGVAWSPDGTLLLVAHSGTGEMSVIHFPTLISRLSRLPVVMDALPAYGRGARTRAEVWDDLGFLSGMRQRLKLPAGSGPRALCVAGNTACVANYFSDTLGTLDLSRAEAALLNNTPAPEIGPIALGSRPQMSLVRKGEFYFHDAGICRQGWQSCASCHPGEGRTDALTWDLLNDGEGNPKNTKSLLLSFQTPPAMSLGIRDSAATAVRSGIKYILFTKQPEEVALALDAYIQSLSPVPSPYLVKAGGGAAETRAAMERGGKLIRTSGSSGMEKAKAPGEPPTGWSFSPAATRGKALFSKAGCAACHPPGLYTDLHHYDVGTRNSHDADTDEFDTPTLVELWRTAPYLHDSSAATVRDVLTTCNPHDRHGVTSNLSSQEIDDLCAFLLSL